MAELRVAAMEGLAMEDELKGLGSLAGRDHLTFGGFADNEIGSAEIRLGESLGSPGTGLFAA